MSAYVPEGGPLVHVWVLTCDGGESGWHVAFAIALDGGGYRGILRSIPPDDLLATSDMISPVSTLAEVKDGISEAIRIGFLPDRDTLEEHAVESTETLEMFLAGRPWLWRIRRQLRRPRARPDGWGSVMAQCKMCHAPIIWAKAPDGSWLPVDARPVADGEVVLSRDEGDGRRRATVVESTQARRSEAREELGTFRLEAPPDKVKRYTSHFRTCAHMRRSDARG